MHNAIDLEIKRLIDEIIYKIKHLNIDLIELCQKLYLSEEEFINYINVPRKNISLYLEILNTMQELEEA